MPNYIGREIGGYKIDKFIAKGGMGSVYLAKHPILAEKPPVAIKVLHSHLVETSNLKARFRREAQLQSGLKHDSLIQLHQYIEDKKDCFIIMEYFESKSLSEVIGRETGPMPSDKAIPIFKQILEGVQYAHEQNIIHRDIKPSNILIGKNDVVKITDFGIAKVVDDNSMTATGSVIGTKLYMSPEQIEGKRATKSSDIYSLGVTFYEMLAGRVPFESDNDFTVMKGHIGTEPDPPTKFYPHIPSNIVNAVMQSISKKPKDRFNSCKAFINSISGKVSASIKGDNTESSDDQVGKSIAWVITGILVMITLFIGVAMFEEDTTSYSSKRGTTTTTTTNTNKKPTKTTIKTARSHFEEGIEHYGNGNDLQALASFDRAVKMLSNKNLNAKDKALFQDARFKRAQSNYRLENYQKAITDLNFVILSRKDPEYLLLRGWAYLETEVYNLSEADFTNYIKLSSTKFEGYYGRGLAKLFKENYSQSLNDFTKAIKINKNDTRLYQARSWAWQNLNQKKKACEDLYIYEDIGGKKSELVDFIKEYYDQNCN